MLQPWATPAARQLLDSYFKIEHAKEEIVWLDIEIQCVVTYIQDEREFLVKKEEEVRVTVPGLAFFICRYCMEWGRFDEIHMDRFRKLEKKWGARFTGTLVPGVRVKTAPTQEREELERQVITLAWEIEFMMLAVDSNDEWEDDPGEEADGEEVAEAMETVLTMAADEEIAGLES
ncbi:hypothetical protein B0H10DRAFT_2222454 [Mycena sp. CBHHK59/15]|nr:hypothetical protein B0H10DRAFT_2222454 [Mycena sp. CBHHK59/15]